jgi:ribonuclease HI
MTAVYHALALLPIPPHSSIALYTDNIAVRAYIAKWGGSANPALHRLTQQIWDLLLQRKSQIHSVHYIPTKLNRRADWLSRLL